MDEDEYRVTWEIDLSATNPFDAARAALKMQRNPDSIATVFTVENSEGQKWQVDLTSGAYDMLAPNEPSPREKRMQLEQRAFGKVRKNREQE